MQDRLLAAWLGKSRQVQASKRRRAATISADRQAIGSWAKHLSKSRQVSGYEQRSTRTQQVTTTTTFPPKKKQKKNSTMDKGIAGISLATYKHIERQTTNAREDVYFF